MKRHLFMVLLLGMMGSAAGADSVVPLVTMSAKAITASVHSVTFTLKGPIHEAAKTRVFTMTGQEVAELDAQSLNRFTWDGKDYDQQDVSSGLYVVQIHENGEVWHGPVMVNR